MRIVHAVPFFILLVMAQSCSTAPKSGSRDIASDSRIASALDPAKVGIASKFVPIPHGTFEMGTPENQIDRGCNDLTGSCGKFSDETRHQVTISQDFEMQVTTVTQLQWYLVMGNNGDFMATRSMSPDCKESFVPYFERSYYGVCPNRPADVVTWDDAQKFIQALNDTHDGYVYRLPTEAEWEYAARAGSDAAFSFGDNESDLAKYGWYRANSKKKRRPSDVASLAPNKYGLYDMQGNVLQYVQDTYSGDYAAGPQTDPLVTESRYKFLYHVARGGSYLSQAFQCRSAYRYRVSGLAANDSLLIYNPNTIKFNGTVGFRLVRTRKN